MTELSPIRGFAVSIALLLALTLAGCASTPAEPPEDSLTAEETPETPEVPDGPEDSEEPEEPAGPAVLDFAHMPPGQPIPGTVHASRDDGYPGAEVIAPDMRFPMLNGPAYANSQIFNPTWGSDVYVFDGVSYSRPVGPQNTPTNYDYPWRDNFCEVRGHTQVRCPDGHGHEGQDIRPATCAHTHMVVAAEGGVLDVVSALTVDLIADSGRTFRYLHLDRPLEPGIGDGVRVEQGNLIGRVSNVSGGTPVSPVRLTTIHLHFEIWDGTPIGTDPLSPYTSLVESYRRLGGEDPANHARIADIENCT